MEINIREGFDLSLKFGKHRVEPRRMDYPRRHQHGMRGIATGVVDMKTLCEMLRIGIFGSDGFKGVQKYYRFALGVCKKLELYNDYERWSHILV